MALYISALKDDTNGDGKLSEKDGITLALAHIDGTKYSEVDQDISKILDSTVIDNGKLVSFLLHIGTNVVVKKYSIATFELISERIISPSINFEPRQ
ncbi:MAG: hypothetical protein ACI82Z_001591 [Cellvibrionaceae bacterium]